jgi:hypothetical protein
MSPEVGTKRTNRLRLMLLSVDRVERILREQAVMLTISAHRDKAELAIARAPNLKFNLMVPADC